MSEWISVEDEMPKKDSWVCTFDKRFVDFTRIDGDEDPATVYFSHWFYIPEPPK